LVYLLPIWERSGPTQGKEKEKKQKKKKYIIFAYHNNIISIFA